MFWNRKPKVKQPSYEDLMAIVSEIEKLRENILIEKYLVMHVCFEIFKLKPEAFNYLIETAVKKAGEELAGTLEDTTWRSN